MIKSTNLPFYTFQHLTYNSALHLTISDRIGSVNYELKNLRILFWPFFLALWFFFLSERSGFQCPLHFQALTPSPPCPSPSRNRCRARLGPPHLSNLPNPHQQALAPHLCGLGLIWFLLRGEKDFMFLTMEISHWGLEQHENNMSQKFLLKNML